MGYDLGQLAAARVDFELNLAKLKADVNLAKAELTSMERQAAPAKAAISNIFSGAKNEVSGFISNISAAKTAITAFISAMAVRGIYDMVKGALEAGAQIKILAEQSGFTTEKLQQLQYRALQFGIGMDSITNGVLFFNKSFGKFLDDQSGPGAKAFTELGIKAAIEAGQVHNAGEAFDLFTEKVSHMSNTMQIAGYMTGVFGRELGPRMTPLVRQTAEEIAKLNNEAQKTGAILSNETADAAEKANAKLDTMWLTLKKNWTTEIVKLAPEIEAIAQDLISSMPALMKWVDEWAQWFGIVEKGSAAGLEAQIARLKTEIASIQEGQTNTWSLTGIFGDHLGDVLKDRIAQLAQLERELAAVQNAAGSETKARTFGNEPTLKLGPKSGGEDIAAKQKTALDALNQEVTKSNATMVKEIDATNIAMLKGKVGFYAAELQAAQDFADAEEAEIQAGRQRQIDAINDPKLKLSLAQRNAAMLQIEQDTANKFVAIEEQKNVKIIEITKEAEGPLRQLADELSKPLDQALGQVGVNALNTFADTLAKVVMGAEKGKKAFHDMVQSIISDLVKLMIQRNIEAPLAGALQAAIGAPASGVGANATAGSGLFAPGLMSSIWGSISDWFGGFLAGGGPASAGNAYVVGESGPEWFVPDQSGTVVPGMASGANIVHVHQQVVVHPDVPSITRATVLGMMEDIKAAAVSGVKAARSRGIHT